MLESATSQENAPFSVSADATPQRGTPPFQRFGDEVCNLHGFATLSDGQTAEVFPRATAGSAFLIRCVITRLSGNFRAAGALAPLLGTAAPALHPPDRVRNSSTPVSQQKRNLYRAHFIIATNVRGMMAAGWWDLLPGLQRAETAFGSIPSSWQRDAS